MDDLELIKYGSLYHKMSHVIYLRSYSKKTTYYATEKIRKLGNFREHNGAPTLFWMLWNYPMV